MSDRISVIVRYPDHVETILIAPTYRRRGEWHEVKPEIHSGYYSAKTCRILEWREAYRCRVGNYPTNEQTAEAIGCSVSTVKYHLRKARSVSR